MAQVESVPPASILLDPQVKENMESYVGMLVRVSRLLVSNEFPLEVQCFGDKMRQHLLRFRHEELSGADLLNLKVDLVVSPDEDHTSSKSANAKEHNKDRRSLLVLAVSNNLRSLEEEETDSSQSENEGSFHINISDGSSHSSSSGTTDSSATSNGLSSEGSNNNNISCMGSIELSSDAETDWEIQSLMAIDISDDNEVNGGSEGQDDFADIVHPQMLRFYGKSCGNQLKGCLLLAEHNILCKTFVAISSSRNPMHKGVMLCVLDILNMIWNQREWENTYLLTSLGLSCLFSDCYFLKTVYEVVEFCERELKRSIGEEINETQSYHTYFASLLRLILPFLLQLLRCIHSLWRDQISCNLSEEIERAIMAMNGDEDFEQNEIGELLEKVRESGYKVIGLCMSIEGAFADLLDKSSFTVAFADFHSMQFKHLRKLIDAVFLPLVRNCPTEFWKEWMLDLLITFLRHCEDVLYPAWFSLMHEGRAKVPYYFGQLTGSAENIEKLEHSLLLDFTRAVCRLVGNISSLESNNDHLQYFEDFSDRRMTAIQDVESVSSSSLIGFLLAHDCFQRLRVSLFGYWVDDEATRNAIPFCRHLVWLAGVTKDPRLKLFVLDELLPSLIRRIDDQLPCAIRHLICKLNSNISDDVNNALITLCRESYNYLSSNADAERQNILGEDKVIGNLSDNLMHWLAKQKKDNFMHWLAKQKKDLRTMACLAAPNEFDGWKVEWNWEFEDEFRRYLPLYIGMLKEVDAIHCSSKDDHSDWEFLEKLNPEFRFKYAINSVEHHHFLTISNIRRRQYYSMAEVRNHNEVAMFLSKIIAMKPYIKGSDDFYSVMNRLENIETPFSYFYAYDVEDSVRVLLDSVLYFWEPQFHPLIREGHKDLLLWIIEQLAKGKEFEDFQPLTPDPRDFPTHLEPYVLLYIMTKLKTSEYAMAQVQLHLHQEYDNYLASGELDTCIYESASSEESFSGIDVDSCTVPHKFLDLDRDLIKLSLQRRAAIVLLYNDYRIYSDCIRGLIADELLKSRLTNLMRELEVKGFFAVDTELVNWEEITELVDKFRDEVFQGHSLPRHYVIRGIIDYRTIFLQKDTWEAFMQVVGEPLHRLNEYLPKFWKETRHYKNKLYDIVREPLKKIFVESLVPSDHT